MYYSYCSTARILDAMWQTSLPFSSPLYLHAQSPWLGRLEPRGARARRQWDDLRVWSSRTAVKAGVYIPTYLPTCMHACIHTDTNYENKCACAYIYIYMYPYIHVHAYMYIYTYIKTCTYTYTYMCVCAYTYT